MTPIATLKEMRQDLKKLIVFNECIAAFEHGLSVKIGFHNTLYLKSLEYLSTDIHREYIERAYKMEDIGCFALTEFDHGSNVRDIQTTAHYDEKT